jgi:hypothetical protein
MASVRRPAVFLLVTGAIAAAFALAGLRRPASPAPTDTPGGPPADRDQLAGLAAAAKDKRYVATYTFAVAKRADRTVTVAYGSDGSWVVGIPAGGLGGLADVAVFSAPAAGLFQCALGPAAGTVGARPDLGPVTAGCVKVDALGPTTDPRVEHLFTDWIDALVDRATALSVRRRRCCRRVRNLLLGRVHLGRARTAGLTGRLLPTGPTASSRGQGVVRHSPSPVRSAPPTVGDHARPGGEPGPAAAERHRTTPAPVIAAIMVNVMIGAGWRVAFVMVTSVMRPSVWARPPGDPGAVRPRPHTTALITYTHRPGPSGA